MEKRSDLPFKFTYPKYEDDIHEIIFHKKNW